MRLSAAHRARRETQPGAIARINDATADPKLVVAFGDCGCAGGIIGENNANCGRVSDVMPVGVAVNGCPPARRQILSGLVGAIFGMGRWTL